MTNSNDRSKNKIVAKASYPVWYYYYSQKEVDRVVTVSVTELNEGFLVSSTDGLEASVSSKAEAMDIFRELLKEGVS